MACDNIWEDGSSYSYAELSSVFHATDPHPMLGSCPTTQLDKQVQRQNLRHQPRHINSGVRRSHPAQGRCVENQQSLRLWLHRLTRKHRRRSRAQGHLARDYCCAHLGVCAFAGWCCDEAGTSRDLEGRGEFSVCEVWAC